MAVYFLRCGDAGPVKIGMTNNVPRRIRELSEAFWEELRLIRCLEGMDAVEHQMHRRFAAQHLRYEWFTFHPDMLGDLGVPEYATPIPAPVELPQHFVRSAELVALRDWMQAEGVTVEAFALGCGIKINTAVEWLSRGVTYTNRNGIYAKFLAFTGDGLAPYLDAARATLAAEAAKREAEARRPREKIPASKWPAMYGAGKPLGVIARQAGQEPDYVRQVVLAAGVTLRKRGRPFSKGPSA